MRHRIIDIESNREWDFIVSKIPHACAHENSYCRAMSLSSGMKISLHVFESNSATVIIPLAERHRREGYIDLVSPYGFGGFAGDTALLSSPELAETFTTACKKMNFVSAYIMQHPSFSINEAHWEGKIWNGQNLYEIDLTQEKDLLWSTMCKTHRYEIRKLSENKSCRLSYDKTLLKNEFKKLYQETIERVHASSVYSFSDQTIDLIFDSCQSIAAGIEDNSVVKAVSIFLYSRDCGEYFLNASSLDGRIYSRLLLWNGIETLKELGVKSLNLGGGIREGDSLSNFKRRFGGKAIPMKSLKMIFSETSYQELCKLYCSPELSTGTYFPPYWAPAALKGKEQ